MDQGNSDFDTYIWHIYVLAKSKSPALFLEPYQLQRYKNCFKSLRRNLAERVTDLYFAGYYTIGFGMAWATVRYKKFYLGTFSLEGKIDLAAVKQSEAKLTGATGEGMADFFDVEM